MNAKPNPDGELVVGEVLARQQVELDHKDYAADRGWSTRKADKADLLAFKQAAKDTFQRIKALNLAAKIACGDILEHVGDTPDGQPVYGETKNADRLRAIEFITNHAYGMPRQSVELDLNPESPQRSETGEAVMARIQRAMLATLATAPEAEKARFLALLAGPKAVDG